MRPRRPFLLTIAVIVAAIAGGSWYATRWLDQATPQAALPPIALQETQLEERSQKAIAERLGGPAAFTAMKAYAKLEAPTAERSITPTSPITILKPDGKGGIEEQQLPVMTEFGYRVREVDAEIWHVLIYDGYMRADPRMLVPK